MDKPVTPEEELLDAVSALTLTLEKLHDLLEVLACEVIVAGGALPFQPDDEPPA
jgi:hypothetical protein